MKHLTQEELVESFYGEGGDSASRHLGRCAMCAKAFAALQSDLNEMKFAAPPARDAGFDERVWQSLSGSLPAYEARKRSRLCIRMARGLSYAAACALLVAMAFFAGRAWEHKQVQSMAGRKPAQTQQNAAHPQEHVVVVVLGDHLDRSERLLVELKHADASNDEMVSPLRDEAQSLLAANRVCRQDTRGIGDPELATALGRLDRLLGVLANKPGGLTAEAITQLQQEMNVDGLLFQVRVLRSRIPDRQLARAGSPDGGKI